MHAARARREGEVHDAIVEHDQHVVSVLAIVETLVLSRDDETAIKNLADIREVITMGRQVQAPLAIIPGAAIIGTHIEIYIII